MGVGGDFMHKASSTDSLFSSPSPMQKLHVGTNDTFRSHMADSSFHFSHPSSQMVDDTKLLPAMNNLFGGMY